MFQCDSILRKRSAIVLLSPACNACTFIFQDSLLTCWNRGRDSHILIETLPELRGNQWDFLTVHASLTERGSYSSSHTFQIKAMFGCENMWDKSSNALKVPSRSSFSFWYPLFPRVAHHVAPHGTVYHSVQFCVAWVFAMEIYSKASKEIQGAIEPHLCSSTTFAHRTKLTRGS